MERKKTTTKEGKKGEGLRCAEGVRGSACANSKKGGQGVGREGKEFDRERVEIQRKTSEKMERKARLLSRGKNTEPHYFNHSDGSSPGAERASGRNPSLSIKTRKLQALLKKANGGAERTRHLHVRPRGDIGPKEGELRHEK